VDKPIYLIGARASGKSTLAKIVATRLRGYQAIDTDLLLTERLGTSIADFVSGYGWSRFREEECLTLSHVARMASTRPLVVATGGGIVLDPRNCQLMASTGWVCYLKVSEAVLIERLKGEPKGELRPSLGKGSIEEEVKRVLVERSALYEACANYILLAERPCEELCLEITEKYQKSVQ